MVFISYSASDLSSMYNRYPMVITAPMTTTTSSPDSDAVEDRIVVNIKKSFLGTPFYTLDEFHDKFNRTAIIKKPPDGMWERMQEHLRHSMFIRGKPFDPTVPPLDLNPSTIEPRGLSPKVPAKTQFATNALGTRTFLPALVCFVLLLSLTMILFAVLKFAASRCRRKKLKNTEIKVDQEPCWTVLPSAPPPDEMSESNAPRPDVSLSDPDYPPPDYESLFSVPSRAETINERLVTNTGSRYASEACAGDVENSMPLHPLLNSPDGIVVIKDDLSRRHIQK